MLVASRRSDTAGYARLTEERGEGGREGGRERGRNQVGRPR